MDGRIKEVLPNGAIYWNYKYYDPNQNPGPNGAMNNSFHLRVKYNSEDGSFTENWKDEDPVVHATTDDPFVGWPEYFLTNTADPSDDGALTHPKYTTIEGDGFTEYQYTNGTSRKKYVLSEDRSTKQKAPLYDDIFSNNTFIRYYWNGTISWFKYDADNLEVFVKHIKAPAFLFEENDYVKYTAATQPSGVDVDDFNYDGFSWIQYNNLTERIYWPVPTADKTRYYNLTSIKYEEYLYNDANYYRVVFNNGTIALYYYGYISDPVGADPLPARYTPNSASDEGAD